MNPFTDFMDKAKGLTKNPLGIIALFISLIYGFACLVLSTSLKNLEGQSERLPLVWFIIVFPILILIGFIYLVVNHHEKLYSPGDYRADDAFIQTIDKHKVKEKQLKEIKTLEEAKTIEENTDAPDTQLVGRDIQPEKAKEKAETISKEPEVMDESKLIEVYSNAEKWAAQELSLKYNVIFKTNVSLATQNGKFELDAYGHNSEKTYIAEIKYWQTSKSDKKLKLSIQEFLSRHKRIEQAFKRTNDFKIIIVLVFDDLKSVNRNDLLEFVKGLYNDANVEFFDYEELKKNYE